MLGTKTLQIKLLFYIGILLFELACSEVWNLIETGQLLSWKTIFYNIFLYLLIGIMLFILAYNFFKLKHYKKLLFSKTILLESAIIGVLTLSLFIFFEKVSGLKPRGTLEPTYAKSWKEILNNSPFYVLTSLYLTAISYLINIKDKINKNCP
jgi:hypothetical protein